MEFTKLQFDYTNWHGNDHTYLVQPISLKYEEAQHDEEGGERTFRWALRCLVLERDGVKRAGTRSFVLEGLRDVKEVMVKT